MKLPDPREQPTLSAEMAGALLGIGRRSATYASITRGDFPAPWFRVGGRIIVPTAGVLKVLGLGLDGQPSMNGDGDPTDAGSPGAPLLPNPLREVGGGSP